MLQAQVSVLPSGSTRGAAAVPRRPSCRHRSSQVQGLAARGDAAASSSGCPYAAASSAWQTAVRQLGGEQQGAQPQRQGALGGVQTPGPDAFSLQSLQDVRWAGAGAGTSLRAAAAYCPPASLSTGHAAPFPAITGCQCRRHSAGSAR